MGSSLHWVVGLVFSGALYHEYCFTEAVILLNIHLMKDNIINWQGTMTCFYFINKDLIYQQL